jgi:hypothetical protein
MVGSIDAKGVHAEAQLVHTEELNADWELAADEKPLNPIAPLR